MCFRINKETPDPLIAEEDITCWKVLYRIRGAHEFRSPYQRYRYAPDVKHEEIELKVVPGSKYDYSPEHIEEGYHSYIDRYKAEVMEWAADCVVKCAIPKGSKYYVNNTSGEYVSSNLKIIGLCAS